MGPTPGTHPACAEAVAVYWENIAATAPATNTQVANLYSTASAEAVHAYRADIGNRDESDADA